MQIPSKELELFIVLVTAVFVLAPVTLVLLVNQYNLRKKRYTDDTTMMKQNFENEIARARVEVHEQTLETVGADLHDHIGQLLSLTNLTLKSIEEHNPLKTKEKVASAIALTSKSIQELRLLGKLLQGEQVLVVGLVESIRHELEWLERVGTLTVILQHTGKDQCTPLDPNRELMAFRIFQEALNNIIKHAEATAIEVNVVYSAKGLGLTISDNGRGFDTGESLMRGHCGLTNMRNRAALIKGTTEIVSSPGRGTTISLTVPHLE